MPNTATAQDIFYKKGTLVFWTDPAQRDGHEHSSGVYVITDAPVAQDYDADELNDGAILQHNAIYSLRNASGDTADVLHRELRAMSESERHSYYLRRTDNICPYCLKDSVEGGSVEIDGNEATQEVVCTTCEASWIDMYKRRDFNLEEPSQFAITTA